MKKSLEEMTKIELLAMCKKYRFVLFKLNEEIENLKREIEILKKK